MKNIPVICIILLSAFVLLRCNKDVPDERKWPKVITLPVTDITELGARFNAEIVNRGDLKILSYGFVWDEKVNPVIESSDRVISSDDLVLVKFSGQISTTLGKDVIYHVRAFLRTDDYLVYGKDVEFKSLGSSSPKIISFTPKTGTWGDTIQIRGKNFSYLDKKNIVKLGQVEAQPYYASDTLLKITVPELKNNASVKINISILGNTAASEKDFHYMIPEITGISPLSGTFLDTLTITGKNFGKEKRYNAVFFNDISSEIISASSSGLKIIVPVDLIEKESFLRIVSVGNELVFNQRFMLNPPVVNLFEPDTVTHQYEIITFHGKNFNPVIKKNKVIIEEYEAEVLESSGVHLKAKLPYGCIQYFNVSVFKTVNVLITVGDQSAQLLNGLPISMKSKWTRKNDFPGPGRIKAVTFAVSGKGYYGTGFNPAGNVYFNDFWEYDQTTDTWTRISDLPGSPRAAAVAFNLSDKGYVGTGTEKFLVYGEDDRNHLKDFYSYDPVTGSWSRLSDFQGIGRHSAACFTIPNEAFVGTGHWGNDFPYGNLQKADDFWKYDPISDTWTEIQKFPFATEKATGFKIGSNGYVYYNRLYQLDAGTWKTLIGPQVSTENNIAFSINNVGYLGLGNDSHNGTNDLWEYNPADQTLVNRHMKFNGQRFGAAVFVINNKAYIIGGNSSNFNNVINEVWEFDPLKP